MPFYISLTLMESFEFDYTLEIVFLETPQDATNNNSYSLFLLTGSKQLANIFKFDLSTQECFQNIIHICINILHFSAMCYWNTFFSHHSDINTR